MKQLSDNEVLFEFHQIGAYMKVSAIDPKTLTEVFVQGPASAARYGTSRRFMRTKPL